MLQLRSIFLNECEVLGWRCVLQDNQDLLGIICQFDVSLFFLSVGFSKPDKNHLREVVNFDPSSSRKHQCRVHFLDWIYSVFRTENASKVVRASCLNANPFFSARTEYRVRLQKPVSVCKVDLPDKDEGSKKKKNPFSQDEDSDENKCGPLFWEKLVTCQTDHYIW